MKNCLLNAPIRIFQLHWDYGVFVIQMMAHSIVYVKVTWFENMYEIE